MRAVEDVKTSHDGASQPILTNGREVILRVVREEKDSDLVRDEMLDRIAAELNINFDQLSAMNTAVGRPERKNLDTSGKLSDWERRQLRRYLDEYRDFEENIYDETDINDPEFANLLGEERLKERRERDTIGAESPSGKFGALFMSLRRGA